MLDMQSGTGDSRSRTWPDRRCPYFRPPARKAWKAACASGDLSAAEKACDSSAMPCGLSGPRGRRAAGGGSRAGGPWLGGEGGGFAYRLRQKLALKQEGVDEAEAKDL